MELSPFLFALYKLVKVLLFPFTWLCLLLGALTILVYLPSARRHLRWIRILAAAACVVLFVLSNPLIARTLLALIEQQALRPGLSAEEKFDAIVVLGGGVHGAGSLRPTTELSSHSLRRSVCGAELFLQGRAPRLVLTGGDGSVFGKGPIESESMRVLVGDMGVPGDAVAVGTRSRNTYENAAEAEQLLGKASVLVVTSASHIPRAVAVFRKQGFDPKGYPCGFVVQNKPGDVSHLNPFDFIPSARALATTTKAINETVGTVVYWVAGKL